jgi:uncharacterized protein (TIGR03083 family)
MATKPLEPVIVREIFPDLRAALLEVLGQLTDEQWSAPTACKGWSVKDVALHILGDDIGNLSRRRDGFVLPAQIDGWDDLVRFINRHNQIWVEATRRISTPMLIALLGFTGPMIDTYFTGLDPNAIGGPVSWAGEGPAPVWLDVAREYTEFWMHLQHICDAVGITRLKDGRHFHPVLDAFIRALPHTYRDHPAQTGTVVILTLTGEAAGSWYLLREEDRWTLYAQVDQPPTCTVTLPDVVAWKLFTRGLSPEEARQQATINGDPTMVEPLLHMVSVIA